MGGKRRNKPVFGGFTQLQQHPVLVGLSRDLQPRPEQATGEIVVHELESAPAEGAVFGANGEYRQVPRGSFQPSGLKSNPDLSGVVSLGGRSAIVQMGGSTYGPTSGSGPGGGGGGGGGGGPGGGGHHGRPWRWWSWLPYYSTYGSWGPGWWPGLPRPTDCERPLSADCTRFRVTQQWAIVCFMAAYNRMRHLYGNDLDAVTRAIVQAEVPGCADSPTNPAQEFRRRVRLATAVLMRSEGLDVPLPAAPPRARPADADSIRQPWLRALLAGWV